MNFTTLQDAIYEWVNGQTGLECIWAFQNTVVPEKPFYTLRLANFTQIGDAENVEPQGVYAVGDFDIYANINFMLEIQGFGPGVMNKTVDLAHSLNSPVVHAQLKSAGVVTWNEPNAVQDISGLDNSQNEERSLYEPNMRTSNVINDVPLGAIEIVNINGTLKQPGKSDITRTLNVDSTI